jgi:hypothetical protein
MRTIALPASRRRTMFAACVATIVLATLQLCGFTRTVQAETVVCNNAPLPQQAIRLGGPSHSPSQPDLLVNGPCGVPPGVYYFGNVNIVDGGRITFQERSYSRTQFWAGAIIVENGGALTAGSAAAPFGVQGGSVTIVLYGADKSHGDPDHNPGQGAPCRSPLDPMRDVGPCGIPLSLWNARDTADGADPSGGAAPHSVHYEPLPGDGAAGPFGSGYFGSKVLAVSYGGTLALFGAKGVDRGGASDQEQTAPGLGWVHLAEGAPPDQGATQISLDRAVQGNWMPGDEVVLTAPDGQPKHAEELTIDSINGATVVFHRTSCGVDADGEGCPGLQWSHHVAPVPVDEGSVDTQPGPRPDAVSAAAVALLTRSIAVVAGGDAPGQSFEAAAALNPGYSFGGHTIVRQGFRAWRVQGVAFYRLGQDSRRDHYPINFYLSGPMPADTFVKDSILRDTMSSWYQPHAIMGVGLQRLARYRAIGHDYLTECTYVAGYADCQQ